MAATEYPKDLAGAHLDPEGLAVNQAPSPHPTLAALTSAALAIPGLASLAEAATPEPRQWDLLYFHYREHGERMQVEGLKQRLVLPLGDEWDLSFNGVRDAISGASPIYNLPEIHCQDGRVITPPVLSVSGASGPPPVVDGITPERPPLGGECRVRSARQVMLEDTFQDTRTAGDFRFNHYRGDLVLGLGAGVSNEQDYDSTFASLDLRQTFNDGLTTLAAGYSLASDTLSPLNKPDFTADKTVHQFLLGMTQVLSRHELVQLNLSFNDDLGYLSDPYKNVYVLATNRAVDEARPDRRRQWNLLARYVRYVPRFQAALHLDYRYSTSDWGIDAHTLEASWIQPLGAGWTLTPRIRYYSQGEVDFYHPYLQTLPDSGHYSSDYRLAGFGAISGGLKLARALTDRVQLELAAEWYDRQSRYALQKHTDNAFSDYGFALYSLSLRWRF
ncbi:DUF3570 domain-containing protein [Caldichromatium japonicum]|uniref:DUF3570 domain-containing protein n=1 Tax=Caldichromatium japonicum TaxID=2699430 RepID=A0A6G7VBT0_9GAMM|nr:DUF3570 domain-containing protein [Caldichromatium japonicum]QIK37533.1 DUF3570 domain-containing protein [Caldichromatium japonicum]